MPEHNERDRRSRPRPWFTRRTCGWWRRLAPLFSSRAYRHVCRPVEINPWLDGTGRGTFPNAVRQVQRAVQFARAPEVAHLDGAFVCSGSGPLREVLTEVE